jgi:hypothetical protein
MKENTKVLSSVCFDLNCACSSVLSEEHKAFVSPTSIAYLKAQIFIDLQKNCSTFELTGGNRRVASRGFVMSPSPGVGNSIATVCPLGKFTQACGCQQKGRSYPLKGCSFVQPQIPRDLGLISPNIPCS